MVAVQTIMHIMLIFILAVITHQMISISGSYLHEIGRVQEPYAVFTFSDNRHKSMTMNILMNIFIPNISMIFIFVGITALHWKNASLLMIIYCLSYYIYRFILICLILDRKYLYNRKYELSMALVGILLGILLNIFFLRKENNLFISVSELREELWFAIILVIYETIKNILDMKVKQDDVLTEQQLYNYIEKKFDVFYEKYGELLSINSQNSYLCITLFAIMIFENFNRGSIIRLFENIKVRAVHKATVGIMQIKSNHIISDKQSVIKAYELIAQYGENCMGNELSEDDVEEIAKKYNQGEKYGESIAYIYSRLLEIIKKNEKYQKEFCFDLVREITEISQWNCSTIKDMCEKLQDNCNINLNKIKTNILKDVEESDHIYINRVKNGWELVLKDLNNVEINGNGSYLYSSFKKADVIVLEECYNVKIHGFRFGHKIANEKCTGNVITIRDSYGIIIENVEICGPGAVGIYTSNCEYSFVNSEIRQCTKGAIWSEDSEVEVVDTNIHDCISRSLDLIYSSDVLVLKNVNIYNNYTDLALINTNRILFEFYKIKIFNNSYRKKSFFTDQLMEVRFYNNKQLDWF